VRGECGATGSQWRNGHAQNVSKGHRGCRRERPREGTENTCRASGGVCPPRGDVGSQKWKSGGGLDPHEKNSSGELVRKARPRFDTLAPGRSSAPPSVSPGAPSWPQLLGACRSDDGAQACGALWSASSRARFPWLTLASIFAVRRGGRGSALFRVRAHRCCRAQSAGRTLRRLSVPCSGCSRRQLRSPFDTF
jgi:hypothetical protein